MQTNNCCLKNYRDALIIKLHFLNFLIWTNLCVDRNRTKGGKIQQGYKPIQQSGLEQTNYRFENTLRLATDNIWSEIGSR